MFCFFNFYRLNNAFTKPYQATNIILFLYFFVNFQFKCINFLKSIDFRNFMHFTAEKHHFVPCEFSSTHSKERVLLD